MLFNSYQFIIFFIIVTVLYFLFPHKLRWCLLLVASCIFYMAFMPVYILILLITSLMDYAGTILMEKSEGRKRKLYFIVIIVLTCFPLFVFKYFNFFNSNLTALARFFHFNYPIGMLRLILPIGLSFYTFQSLSYVIEVYRKKQKVEYNPGIYILYVIFYPQLVAGPIERSQNLLHQFYEEHYFDYRRITDGLKLMTWGMFKKIVIADRLAVFVSTVYDSPYNFQGISFMVATIFFAFQIYCDFSGYSDIAIGSAQVMGFRLMDNFNRPYFSRTIAEFWKRWHISLSSWFKDYLYIPLGGNRVTKIQWCYNLFITFLISGLWHGANWTYVVWGALNGFYLIFGIGTKDLRKKIVKSIGLDKFPELYKYIQIMITFVLVCFAWIFFRAKNIHEAFYIVGHLFSGVLSFCAGLLTDITRIGSGKGMLQLIMLGQSIWDFSAAVGSVVFLLFIHLIQRHGSIRHMLSDKPVQLRWTCYCFMGISIWFFGYFNSAEQFIYFQF
jgi:alginate O-acetyltransferase complex protein AlgI